MTRPRRLFAYFFLAATALALPAYAQSGSGTVSAEDQRSAQDHFKKARELYSQGNYSSALKELEIARGLDPKAKDLVMNLGIVSEKLGKLDDALGYMHTFLDMDGVTPAERAKAEGNIKRLEGAKKQQEANKPPPTPSASSTTTAKSATPPPPPPPPKETKNGRVDGLTIAAGSIAAVGLVGGGVLGVLALGKRPNDFTTGPNGEYTDLQSKTNSAHTLAIFADVGLGVGIIATIATLYLYFGRSADDAPKTGRIGFRGVTF